jgi:hypothetical protein
MKPHYLFLFAIGAGLFAAGCAAPPPVPTPHHPPLIAATPAADLWIISATYGSGTHYADVAYRVNDLLRQPDVEFTARPQWLAADPTPGWNKALVIVYEVQGQRHVFTSGEGGRVSVSILLAAAEKAGRAGSAK